LEFGTEPTQLAIAIIVEVFPADDAPPVELHASNGRKSSSIFNKKAELHALLGGDRNVTLHELRIITRFFIHCWKSRRCPFEMRQGA
jgi:hypothetical protein